MKSTSYTIITHSNGKRRIYRTETYLLLRRLKFIGSIIAAIAVMLLMCGMAVYKDSPIMPFQLVVLAEIGLIVLIALVYLYVSDKGACEKQGPQQNKKHRPKR